MRSSRVRVRSLAFRKPLKEEGAIIPHPGPVGCQNRPVEERMHRVFSVDGCTQKQERGGYKGMTVLSKSDSLVEE